ncbi:NADP-dependent malic enzyme [Acholeplasma sp. OttesenSCG-928-E16]|nr:NADP-dependent malic enzyme [Acholeplasma sp. OttesenSCG-928-E16]
MDVMRESLELHKRLKGKIEIKNKLNVKSMDDLSLIYTPGVASPCLEIKNNPKEVFNLTSKRNTVAVISDGTAVLGLGDIGPLAAIPVMEGKCAIFKRFAGVDAIPIVLDCKDTEEIIKTVLNIAPSFGGINLEDISAPRCFEIEKRLDELLDIPVFHDDQHGTAIVTGAALLNSLKIVNKKISKIKIVINGAGSAGIAICKFLLALGAKDIILCDIFGTIVKGSKNLNEAQKEMSLMTNKKKIVGSLSDAIKGADVFIGVSVGNVVSKEMIASMEKDAIVFPLANPVPEISRADALAANARIVGNGLSNYPNQINNSLVFPGLFKGALDARVNSITMEMKVAACKALAKVITKKELSEDYVIPNIFNKKVCKAVSNAVIKVANK